MQQTVFLEPDKFYHVYTRGNNKESIFKDEANYFHFLQLFRKYISPYANTYAYCLLPNHIHFLIQVKPEAQIDLQKEDTTQIIRNKLQRQFSHLFNAYTKAINKRYNRTGSLFQERFRRKEITSELYFTRLIYYIHFNPQHHGLIDNFSDWPYSSYHSILSKSKTLLHRDDVLKWFSSRDWYRKFHEENAADFSSIAPLIEEDDL
ncbi:transposase [Pontibacter vulgaris]|uniref:transposase n=1 Tax=Pontibacter vulgaris TaxID=2905679 RepID=UPI001FA80DFA|nr:transposase [Pontibacter vulgaris]